MRPTSAAATAWEKGPPFRRPTLDLTACNPARSAQQLKLTATERLHRLVRVQLNMHDAVFAMLLCLTIKVDFKGHMNQ